MFNQTDPRIYGQSYIANCSSIDGQGAFLDEPAETYHIEYLQGVSRFQETGLPCRLPAEREAQLARHPQVIEFENRLQKLIAAEADHTLIEATKRKLRLHCKSLRSEALQAFREEWVQSTRDHKILSRGKEDVQIDAKTDIVRTLSSIIPERGRLSKRMISDDILSSSERLQALKDLVGLCVRDFEVLYLPAEEPINGACPVENCQVELST